MIDIDQIIAFEQNELTERQAIKMFAELIRTGQVWQLQGHYGRTARELIDEGLITPDGTITLDDVDPEDFFGDHTDAVLAARARDAERKGRS